MRDIVVTVRAIAIHDHKLLVCKHNETGRDFYNLPGGKLEVGETIDSGMTREMEEESGIKPQLGKLLFISQFINADHHRIEFFFRIDNATDYAHIDLAKASHGFEVSEFTFIDPTIPDVDIKPAYLKAEFTDLDRLGEAFNTKTVTTS